MISFSDISKFFSIDLKDKSCIEIGFMLKGHPKYHSCWMGKTPNKTENGKDIYWFGLVADGSEAYEYDNFYDFSTALIFDNKSLKQVWNNIEIFSINGCEPENYLSSYSRCFYEQK